MIFKPQRFVTKLSLQTKRTLQVSNATSLSSIRQETTKLQEFKVDWFVEQVVTLITNFLVLSDQKQEKLL